MREARVVVASPGARASLRLLCAEDFADRLRGLLGRETLTRQCGLWISPCRAVHTFGMRAPIDLVFVGPHNRILRVDAGLVPGRVRVCRRACGVLELAAGAASRLGLDRPAARLDWPDGLR